MKKKKLAALVTELADREAIRSLPCRYAHHVWRSEGQSIADLFTEDGVFVNADSPAIEGRQALLDFYVRASQPGRGPFPYIHNQVIELNGDKATGWSYLDVRTVDDAGMRAMGGYYDESFVRVKGEWKFKERRFHPLFSALVESGEGE